MAVKETVPTEVIREVMGPDALEMGDPTFESTMIGIDVLDVEGLPDAHACTQVYGFVHKG